VGEMPLGEASLGKLMFSQIITLALKDLPFTKTKSQKFKIQLILTRTFLD